MERARALGKPVPVIPGIVHHGPTRMKEYQSGVLFRTGIYTKVANDIFTRSWYQSENWNARKWSHGTSRLPWGKGSVADWTWDIQRLYWVKWGRNPQELKRVTCDMNFDATQNLTEWCEIGKDCDEKLGMISK